jgi:hypothetical protein
MRACPLGLPHLQAVLTTTVQILALGWCEAIVSAFTFLILLLAIKV